MFNGINYGEIIPQIICMSVATLIMQGKLILNDLNSR